jgi:hypothetical protein
MYRRRPVGIMPLIKNPIGGPPLTVVWRPAQIGPNIWSLAMDWHKIERTIVQAVALSIALLTPYSPLAAQTARGSVAIKSKPVRVEPLVEILNYGRVKELNSENNRDQELRLRLYDVPREGDCVPDTHVVCSHHYYLAVSAFEEGLGENVFDLGEVGEIAEIQWLKPGKPGAACLKIRVLSYPEEYLKSNASLTRKEQSYELEITVEKLVAKPLR